MDRSQPRASPLMTPLQIAVPLASVSGMPCHPPLQAAWGSSTKLRHLGPSQGRLTKVLQLAYASQARPNQRGWGKGSNSRFATFSLRIARKRGSMSRLEPLTCSLRLGGHALQGLARDCKTCISKRLCSGLLRVAPYCALGGVNIALTSASFCGSSPVLVSPR
jgi:hypothetical protein